MKRGVFFLLGLLLSFALLGHSLGMARPPVPSPVPAPVVAPAAPVAAPVASAPASAIHVPLYEPKPAAKPAAKPASTPASAPVKAAPLPKLPGSSAQLLPQLGKEVTTYWPTLNIREFPAGVIDQESNWKVGAALKTKREFGCGLGQFTVAYNADGSVRFNALEETKRLDRSLSGWDMSDCYAVNYQLRAVVLKLKGHSRNCSAYMNGDANTYKCAGGQYNGGAGSTASRIRLCRATPGCLPGEWDNNLDQQCPQARVKVEGYGESFCDINSKYPARVWSRMPKFKGLV